MAVCVQCGKPLQTTRKNAHYCSSTCRSRARRARLAVEKKKRAMTLTFEGAAMLETMRKVLPKTAASVEKFISINGIECAEAAIKLCLSAYSEAVKTA